MHYSGHGDRSFLSMEDGRGNAHFVRVPALKKLLQAGSLASLRFVFVSACFSEAAAQAFVDAGVPHVIAVRLTTRVSDNAAHAFTRAFYLALAVGKTIREAFDIGVQAVVTSPTVRAGEVEGDKFLLLGPGSHDEAPFPAWRPSSTGSRPCRPPLSTSSRCPPAEAFAGRNVETYRVVTGVLDRRASLLTGVPGVGKSAVAIAAINCPSALLRRRHYIDARARRSSGSWPSSDARRAGDQRVLRPSWERGVRGLGSRAEEGVTAVEEKGEGAVVAEEEKGSAAVEAVSLGRRVSSVCYRRRSLRCRGCTRCWCSTVYAPS